MAKPSYDEWIAWAQAEQGVDYNAHATLYRRNIGPVHSAVQGHPFFERLPAVLEQCASEYNAQIGYPLFASRPAFTLEMKGFDALLNKVYRKNCLWNDRFPDPPKRGWITPDNWFDRMDDLVRGLLICRYADGPACIATSLQDEAEKQGLAFSYRTLERDEGYYAYHSYIDIPVTITMMVAGVSGERNVNLKTEIQITTQLHDALRDKSHEIYEKRRLAAVHSNKDWKWDFSSQEFLSGYIGHTLHLLQGLILDLRSKGTDHDRQVGGGE
jgi:ppGpp synthetase/RelA/SpoT-type nucleotidyltranferase